MTNSLQHIAKRLEESSQTGTVIDPIRHELDANDLAAAYQIQQINVQYAVNQGRRIVGRKIGLTSATVQKQLGVDQPDFGTLFSDMAYSDSEVIDISEFIQPKCEAEVALVLANDLDQQHLSLTDLISATAYLLPAIEIEDSRISNWDIGILDTVADNASSAAYVLGHRPVLLADLDLRLAGMVMECNGEPVSFGVGAACLGHPLNAALWLAQKMVEMGTPLRAGDLVLTGALGPMVEVKSGDVFEARIQGLGSVRACFSDAK